MKEPWNKGLKGLQPWHNLSGIGKGFHGHHTLETRLKLSKGKIKENASYSAIHKWLTKWKGKAFGCNRCGTKKKRRYEWSNISGKCKRELLDYESLCVPCHRAKDGNDKFYLFQKRRKIKFLGIL